MVVEKITTCVDRELWRAAVLANVSWAEAMTAGIKLMMGDSMDEQELVKKKAALQGELGIIQDRLNALRNEKNKTEELDTDIKANMGLLRKATPLIMQDITRLKAWRRRWINETGKNITEDAFFDICKRVDNGEFEGGGLKQ